MDELKSRALNVMKEQLALVHHRSNPNEWNLLDELKCMCHFAMDIGLFTYDEIKEKVGDVYAIQ